MGCRASTSYSECFFRGVVHVALVIR
jgi:hypothetical protein